MRFDSFSLRFRPDLSKNHRNTIDMLTIENTRQPLLTTELREQLRDAHVLLDTKNNYFRDYDKFVDSVVMYATKLRDLEKERDNLNFIINSRKFNRPFNCYLRTCLMPVALTIMVMGLLDVVLKLDQHPCQINHEKYAGHTNHTFFNVSANSTTLAPPQKICFDDVLTIVRILATIPIYLLVGIFYSLLYSCYFASAETRMRELNNKPLELISLEDIRTDIKNIFVSILMPYLMDINKISAPDNETSALDICINSFFSKPDEESTNDNDSSAGLYCVPRT